MPLNKKEIYQFEGFTLDPQKRALLNGDRLIALPRRAFEVLLYLVQHTGTAVSKEELLKNVWTEVTVSEGSLMQSISDLRKGLEERPGSNSYIATLPGRGYQFVKPVQRIVAPEDDAPQLSPEWATSTDSVAPGQDSALLLHERLSQTTVTHHEISVRRWSSMQSRTRVAAGALLGLAVLGIGGGMAWNRYTHSSPPPTLVLAQLENTTGLQDFGRTLDQALEIDMAQSPFVSLLPRAQVRETLKRMQRKPDEPLTQDLAREVCERNNAQVVLHGGISQLGSRYLLLLKAEGCASGKNAASFKGEFSAKEDALDALDRAVKSLRRQLGESESSRERYDVPIAQAATPSIEALRLYSLGLDTSNRGDTAAAQALLQRALALDPNFAVAFMSLATTFYNQGDAAQATTFYKKAFDLREHATERDRLLIETFYYGDGLSDYESAIRSSKQLLAIYPKSASSWTLLCKYYSFLGQFPEAVSAGERAVQLDPNNNPARINLAQTYAEINRLDEAKRMTLSLLAEGKDLWQTHEFLLEIALVQHDEATANKEMEWERTHAPLNMSFYSLGSIAATRGQLREMKSDFERAHAEALSSGNAEFADLVWLQQANRLQEMGLPAEATAALKQAKLDGGAPGTREFIAALGGDPGPARQFVARAEKSPDHDTLKNNVLLPQLRAAVALREHHAVEALRLLEPARPYQLADYATPYLRAEAETEAGRYQDAEQDYRLILGSPSVDPIAIEYPLSHLRLGRVLALEKKNAEAASEYKIFLDAWRDADASLPILAKARQEYAAFADGQSLSLSRN